MQPEDMRRDLPITQQFIYFDNAATTPVPSPIIDTIIEYFEEYCANIERGAYSIAAKASDVCDVARNDIATKLLHCDVEEFIFTRNQTQAANFVAYALEHPFLNRWSTGFQFAPPLVKWSPESKIVTTLLEHHSNFMPWLRLAKHVGAQFRTITPTLDGLLLPEMFAEAVDENTAFVAFQHASNAMGTKHDVQTIVRTIKAVNPQCLVFIDGAQAVGHMPVDVTTLGCDFYSFSGHKGPLGPPGTGGLYVREELLQRMAPAEVGGGTIAAVTDSDYMLRRDHRARRWDAGTPNIIGLIGLGAAVKYLNRIGIQKVAQQEHVLTRYLLDGIREISNLVVYGPYEDMTSKIGAVCFNIDGWFSHDVSLALDAQWKILTRAGHHCCMPMMNLLGVLEKYQGNVRASFHYFNLIEEVDVLVGALKTLAG
ncbi:MAG: aminotransferase class V-fold PLP-dependent enzyme [Candidatus Hodarchaeota archaeon]